MKIYDVERLISRFMEMLYSMTIMTIIDTKYQMSKAIDAANYWGDQEQEKLKQCSPGEPYGVYLYWNKNTDEVFYIGKGNISQRFSDHMGTVLSWAREGAKAYFPKPPLVSPEKHWLPEGLREVVKKAEFNVTCIIPNDADISKLIESFLIYCLHKSGSKIGDQLINADF